MKTKKIMIALMLLTTGTAWAEDFPKDSLKIVDIEEVVVIATPKENRKLRDLPVAATVLSQDNMRANQVNSVKNLTGIVPNLFIPDYGSKLTTSIYIRGIGSRINTPSVGLYVDNIPYIDKSAFDFNYADIERIDILRGPQGTLYGRNTMGGLIKVHTKSPFTYQGTDIRMGAATYNNYNVSLTHYHRTSDRFAFSTGGFYEHTGGFFENSARNNEKVDKSNAGGGRFRGIYLPTSNLKIDMALSYEYSDQGGYPYYYTGITPSAIAKAQKDGKEGLWTFSGWAEKITTSPDGNTVLIALTGSWNFTPSEIKTITGVLNTLVWKEFKSQHGYSTEGTFTAIAKVMPVHPKINSYAAEVDESSDNNTNTPGTDNAKTFTGTVNLKTGETRAFNFSAGEGVADVLDPDT